MPSNNHHSGYSNELIAPESQAAEISRFEQEVLNLEQQKLDKDDFARFRLENGVYGIRGTPDEHMIRIKIRFGALLSEQLEAIADVTEEFATPKLAHITTRQAVQIHHIKRGNVTAILKRLTQVGLTTREACGNTVRNVSASPLSGIDQHELFDVTPYADAVSRYFLRHPVCQNLPRKFKIAFEGSTVDRARIPIHDFGAVARIKEIGGKKVYGFRTFVGGGLGTVPFSAHELEEFTPADQLIPTIEAVIRIFDRYGERKNRNTARIKFLVKKWGWEKFKQEFESERRATILTSPGRADWSIEHYEQEPPPSPKKIPAGLPVADTNFERWKQTNVVAQKQSGYIAVQIRCPLGDIGIKQMRGVAQIARRYSGGRIRTIIEQNLLIPWVSEKAVAAVYQELVALGIAYTDAGHLADITRCPGSDTCKLAITHSRGLASSLADVLGNGGKDLLDHEALKNLTIKISGCPNSCGQHHIADLGFHGASTQINGHAVPTYMVMVGGRTKEGLAEFGQRLGMVPAKRMQEATRKLLTLYRDGREKEETFRAWVNRVGVVQLKKELDPFRTLPTFEQDREMYEDLGSVGEFKVEVGEGECAK